MYIAVNIFVVVNSGVNCVLFQETYGECPYLTGMFAQSYVRGLQGNHPRYARATAGCKHFDVHGGPEDIPTSRFSFNSQVNTLHLTSALTHR